MKEVVYTGKGQPEQVVETKKFRGYAFEPGKAMAVDADTFAKCMAMGCFDEHKPKPKADPKPAPKKRGRPKKTEATEE